MVEPVLPGARGPRARSVPAIDELASVPRPLFGTTDKNAPSGPDFTSSGGASPAAVLLAKDVLPPDLDRQLAGRPDGPLLAALLVTLFPVQPDSADVFAAQALQAARAVQERAAALTAEIAERDLNGRLNRLADDLMAQAAPGILERARRALGRARPLFDVEAVQARIDALKRELKIVMPPAARLAEQAAPALDELELSRAALNLARPWLDETAAARRLRLLEATYAGCNLVPAQARQLSDQLQEHADRLQTLESATLPTLRNIDATRRLNEP
jgi:hypothetical protein